MGRDEVTAFIHGIVLHVYHSISAGAVRLNIREKALRAVCTKGAFEVLYVNELKNLCVLLPEYVKEELRRFLIP